jgi:hypothetical protein
MILNVEIQRDYDYFRGKKNYSQVDKIVMNLEVITAFGIPTIRLNDVFPHGRLNSPFAIQKMQLRKHTW